MCRNERLVRRFTIVTNKEITEWNEYHLRPCPLRFQQMTPEAGIMKCKKGTRFHRLTQGYHARHATCTWSVRNLRRVSIPFRGKNQSMLAFVYSYFSPMELSDPSDRPEGRLAQSLSRYRYRTWCKFRSRNDPQLTTPTFRLLQKLGHLSLVP